MGITDRKWKKAGLCVRCGAKRDNHTQKCNACREKMKKFKKNMVKTRKELSNCIRCNEPAQNNRVRCTDCLKKSCESTKKNFSQTILSNVVSRKVTNSKKSDIKSGREIIEAHYITEEYIENMIRIQQNKCFHCDIKMQTENMNKPDGLTIDRIHNNDAHHCYNCVLACALCNRKHYTKKISCPKFQAYLLEKKN